MSEITITPLSRALRDDYLNFFDHDAFADNPRWASCYCMFNQAPHSNEPWDGRTAAQNRAAANDFIESGELRGYLARQDGRVVGWCNANRAARYTTLGDDQTETVGVIACFVVAERYRGQGVARRLLAAALDGFRAEGVPVVEAYPQVAAQDAAENCRGPLNLYLAEGFEQVDERGATALVRKTLA